MKKQTGKLLGTVLCASLMLGNVSTVFAGNTGYTNSFTLKDGNQSVISIDGDFSDWESLPCTYEYNWDNSQNCWQWGVWIDGVCYKTEPGTYSTDVRHKMQMYCDGTNVYLHIVYSRDYASRLNGNDFQFYINGQMSAFQLTQLDGSSFEKMSEKAPGVYEIDVRHRETHLSFTDVEGAVGYLHLTPDKVNNEIEILVPMSEMRRQSTNARSVTTIEFFTPNLMYRRISAVGTSTGPVLLLFMCGGIALWGWSYSKRKRDGNLQV